MSDECEGHVEKQMLSEVMQDRSQDVLDWVCGLISSLKAKSEA